jgi:hypothetical protein
MTETRVGEDAADPLAGLIRQLADGPARTSAARQLAPAVRQAVYPLCLRRLGTSEAAEEAVQETWLRLRAPSRTAGVTFGPPDHPLSRPRPGGCGPQPPSRVIPVAAG